MKTNRAFTLIELLVVVAIVALLATLVVGVAGPFQRNAQFTQGMNNMRQLAAGMMNYCTEHDGELPGNGEPQPAWGAANADDANKAEPWYLAVPRMAGGRAISDFERPADFYTKANLLYVPAAKYPEAKLARPYFGIAMNQRLRDAGGKGSGAADTSQAVRRQSIQNLSRTVIFFESGLPDEETLPGQSAYSGTALGDWRNVVARYNRSNSRTQSERREDTTSIVFADGHVEALPAKYVLDANGGAHFPQLEQDNGQGRVCWTLDPATNPN
jgi:prepilin-type N-terminal cleavage/methylation domain-containing protein/prepilin-type processing-associated H-X9-DG protein